MLRRTALRRTPDALPAPPAPALRLGKTGDVLQPRLSVGAPGDAHEKEAEEVADRVMRTPSGAEAGRKASDEAIPTIRRAPAAASVPEVSPETEAGIGSIRGGGDPLPAGERAFFEGRMGHDFGSVRVHAGARAAGLARSVEAKAFTVGRDIVFGAGEYAPGTDRGRRLLAHELTHTVQQGSALRRLPEIDGEMDGTRGSDMPVGEPGPSYPRPLTPSTAAAQMSALLAAATTSGSPRGMCYRAIKHAIKAAGGYGDLLDLYADPRFARFGVYALQFVDAVAEHGAAALGLEPVDGTPHSAPPGTLLLLRGDGNIRIHETYGDISVIAGKSGSNVFCYNDGRMVLPGSEASWQPGGKYAGAFVAMYRPIDRP